MPARSSASTTGATSGWGSKVEASAWRSSPKSLGPSDSSDSGSDVHGFGAERRIGDAGLDSDTDRSGTGERVGATPDMEFEGGSDIAPDEVQEIPEVDESGEKSGPAPSPPKRRPE